MNSLCRSARVRTGRRLRRTGTHLLALIVALGVALPALAGATASPASAAAAAPDDGELRVLLFYKPNFHASHVQARQAVNRLVVELGEEYGQEVFVEETENAAAFTAQNLATKDAVVFAQTGGVLFNTEQRAALEGYVTNGGGFMGLHYTGWSVGQSEHDVNPFFLRLVGAMSEGHPENPAVRPGKVDVVDPTHPLTADLPAAGVTRSDEWYDWTVNPAQNVRTLLAADESSYGMGRQGSFHPITWCQNVGGGRSWYTGMGHEGSAYSEPFMLDQMRSGLAYASGLLPADCSPPEKDVEGSWSGVTPWPLMPINMALTSDGTVQSFGSVSSGCVDGTPFDFTGNSCVFQGGQMEYDIWDPATPRTLANYTQGLSPNRTYTDLFCAMQVQDPARHATLTVGGDDALGGNAPNDAAIGVTSYTKAGGLKNEAPMNYPRWYPTGTTMPNGDIVVQGGSLRGGPGGPGVLTPEIRTPNEGSGWKLLTGARSAAAYGDGGNGNGPDENRWWYPRAFVAPGSGTLFNISGTQMFELDPAGNNGAGKLDLRGTLPSNIANQGADGNPVGATSTAAMYRPGKILQVGGGWWANGGGPAGARGGFTVDITGGTADPVVAKTAPMKYQRHWPTATMMPDGNVLVTGGSRENNGNGGYVTNAEIWNPDTGQWTTVEVPHEHARLYHSSALLLPDGRVMIGGGGAPGPRNYTDVEYYSPSYLFDGQDPAVRPVITNAPEKIGYDGTFQIGSSAPVSRVTLVRNGSVTHGFNNDQNFQDLEFTQDGSSLSITAPEDGTYAPPGTYMLFVFNADGTPSVAKMVDIDPSVEMDVRTPEVVDQFEYPRIPDSYLSGGAPTLIDVAPGAGRMAPWTIRSAVQLVLGTAGFNGGLGGTGYQLALGSAGSIERALSGLDVGREYRISLRLARDSRATGTAPGTASLKVGDLDAQLSTTNSSQGTSDTTYGTYVGTFTASSRSETLRLAGPGTGPGLMIDDLVVIAAEPGVDDAPVHYEFEEGTGRTAANTGTDTGVGAATLTGDTGWSPNGIEGGALNLPGGPNSNAVDLPDNLLLNATDFTTSFWVRPDTKGNWINLLHLGDGTGDGTGASFFQIQMQTQAAAGGTGLAATFKGKGTSGQASQQRLYATPTRDVAANRWNHVVFTRSGSTGTLFLDGQQIAQRNDFTITMSDVGTTTNNWIGRNGFPDPALDGLVDELRMYRTALSPADVAGLYTEGSALRTTTTLQVAPASPSAFDAPITVTANVADQNGTAARGTAELWVDGARVGEARDVVAGSVEFPGFTRAPGEHSIEVRFLGAVGFRDSVATATQTVLRPPPGAGVPVHYQFNEGSGTTAANTGTDRSVGAATLEGTTSFVANGKYGSGINLPGGASGTNNQVRLPNDIEAGLDEEFSVSIWARPDALPNWVPLVQIGSSTDTFFLLQSSTQANGPTGFAATFKAPGNAAQERLTLGRDLPLNQWTHVVFTMYDRVGKIYFDGQLVGTRTDFNLGIGDVGVNGRTAANFIGGTSWPDPRFDGLVDDFRLYGYELDQQQVTDLFQGAPANAAPVGVPDSYSTEEGKALTVAAPGVLGNDTDADNTPLTAVGLTQPANGEVALNANGSFTYTPDAGFDGTDTFTYRASDGTAESAATTVTITVTPAPVEPEPENVAPVGVADAYDVAAGQTLRVAAPGVLGNDTDADGDTLTAGGLTQPANGQVTLSADGSFVYTPPAGFVGRDRFSYTASDGEATSAPTTVTITVTGGGQEPPPQPGNRTPVAAGDGYDAVSGVARQVAAPGVLGNDTDADGDRLTATNVTQPTNGRVTLNADGSFTYTSAAGFVGTDRFTYTASDGRSTSAPATVTMTVAAPPNTAPTAVADEFDAVAGETLRVAAPGVLGNDTDAEGDELTATGVTQPANGEVVMAADGSFVYFPDDGFTGRDRFTYVARDGQVGSAPATVTLTVTAKETPPPTTTSLSGTASQMTYGQGGSVRVAIDPASATGEVQVLDGTRPLGSATLAGGSALVVLPAGSLAPGTYQLTLRYEGDTTHAASTATMRLVVRKATPSMRIQAPGTVKQGVRPNVTVRLWGPNQIAATGPVDIEVLGNGNGNSGGKVNTRMVKNGQVAVTLRAVTQPMTVRITYRGNQFLEPLAETITIGVRRR